MSTPKNLDERLEYLKTYVRTQEEEKEFWKRVKSLPRKSSSELDRQTARRDELLAKEFLNRLPEHPDAWFESMGTRDSQRDKFMHLTEIFYPEVTQLKNESKKIGRNDPCPCNSGKKYKKCCG